MSNILTDNDKKYLGSICRYLGSYNMTKGFLEFFFDSDEPFDFGIYEMKLVTYFDNNQNIEIPGKLYPIIDKVMSYVTEVYKNPDLIEIANQRMVFTVNCKLREVYVTHIYEYEATEITGPIVYEGYEELFEILFNEGFTSGIQIISYRGDHGAGKIDTYFENMKKFIPNKKFIPWALKDWAYAELERRFGFWDRDEGAQGQFVVNIDDKTITLTHEKFFLEKGQKEFFSEKF